jgi:hypothetical protein
VLQDNLLFLRRIEMMTQAVGQSGADRPDFLNIEGKDYPWPAPTISTEQIAELGGWSVSQGVVEIDADNGEHTLSPGQVIEKKPGHGFGRKVKWKRG